MDIAADGGRIDRLQPVAGQVDVSGSGRLYPVSPFQEEA
jgi:hypothetical protein